MSDSELNPDAIGLPSFAMQQPAMALGELNLHERMTLGAKRQRTAPGFQLTGYSAQTLGCVFLLVLGGFSLGRAADPLTLQTGGGMTLTRVSVSLEVPPNYPSASVRFEVSFGTDEQLLAGEFIDSFTVSLRNTNRTVVATVLTVDRFGFIWAPASPGAQLIPNQDLQFEPWLASSTNTNFNFQASYAVVVELPAALLNEPAVLALSLFDNQDTEPSRAVLTNLRVQPGMRSILAVDSSAAAAGPYARESGFVNNPIQRTVTLLRAGGTRFYRLRGDTDSRITGMSPIGSNINIHYQAEVGELDLQLEGADDPEGPFARVGNAVFNLPARTVSVPLLNAPGFFLMAGSPPARIINDEVTGEFRVLEFEIFPKPPQLESSAQLLGPYALEDGVLADPFARKLTLLDGGRAHFYRLIAEVPFVVRALVPEGDNLILFYEEP